LSSGERAFGLVSRAARALYARLVGGRKRHVPRGCDRHGERRV